MASEPGKVIFLNGASSSGKSTLARHLQSILPEPFWHFSIDHFIDSGMLPSARIRSGEFPWKDMRESFFDGFHRCLPSLVGAGNNLIVEHIIETEPWRQRLQDLLGHHDVFLVGVHCPVVELERRERERGDRPIGDARRDFEVIHTFCGYDFEADSTRPVEETAQELLVAWQDRQPDRVVRFKPLASL
ncbi:MAG: AAA family ATPase [Armatimonadetes bacterium]|nr:AAA family ATPase [Armatimonadota bacterium]